MLERSLQRRVLELKARCSRTEVGCKWVDELRHLDHHETESVDGQWWSAATSVVLPPSQTDG